MLADTLFGPQVSPQDYLRATITLYPPTKDALLLLGRNRLCQKLSKLYSDLEELSKRLAWLERNTAPAESEDRKAARVEQAYSLVQSSPIHSELAVSIALAYLEEATSSKSQVPFSEDATQDLAESIEYQLGVVKDLVDGLATKGEGFLGQPQSILPDSIDTAGKAILIKQVFSEKPVDSGLATFISTIAEICSEYSGGLTGLVTQGDRSERLATITNLQLNVANLRQNLLNDSPSSSPYIPIALDVQGRFLEKGMDRAVDFLLAGKWSTVLSMRTEELGYASYLQDRLNTANQTG